MMQQTDKPFILEFENGQKIWCSDSSTINLHAAYREGYELHLVFGFKAAKEIADARPDDEYNRYLKEYFRGEQNTLE